MKTYMFKMYSNHGNCELRKTIDGHAHVWNHFVALCRRYYAMYDEIRLEDLNIQGIKALWGRKVSDLGFADFVKQLKYLAPKKGVKITFIDKWYPSSRTCSVCGTVNEALNLRDRTWQCPNCHTQLDRDRNAAVNIYRVGASTHAAEVVSPGSPG